MRLTLRIKFFIFNILLLSVGGLLIHVLNTPYREMKSLMNTVRMDIAQIMEAEQFIRSIYEQQHEVAKILLTGQRHADRNEFDQSGRQLREIFSRWREAFEATESTPDKKEKINRHLNRVEEAYKYIQDVSASTIQFAQSGNNPAAVRAMDMTDSSIRQDLLPAADAIIKELETEVNEDLPLLFSSLQHTAVLPPFKTDIQLKELSHELEHALQIQKISRFFSGKYLDILHLFAGSASHMDKDEFASFRNNISNMLDLWTKGTDSAKEDEEKREDEKEISIINSMMPFLDRIEMAGLRAAVLSGQGYKAFYSAGLQQELNEIDSHLAGQFDLLVSNENMEIRKRIDTVVRVVDRARKIIFTLSVLIAGIGILTLWFLFKNMVSPVIQLRNAAVKIGRGDFSTEISVKTDDEIGDLADSFDNMRKDLDASVNKLKDEIIIRKRAEAEKEDVIMELRLAIGKIKTLSGMLPICASCKKIRDDKGYWNQIEAYISDHSEAEFTHGYCPECAEKVKKEIDRLKRSQGNL